MYNLFQLLLLTAMTIIALSLTKKYWIKSIIAFILTLFICLQLTSLQLTDELINYRFYQHLNIQSLLDFGFQFKFEIIMFVIIFITMFVFYLYLSKYIEKKPIVAKAVLLILSLTLLSLNNGAFHQIYKIIELNQAEQKNFSLALKELNINENEYIKPQEITAIKGKNIIVLSLESYEQGFLNPPFKSLTPNLNKLKESWTYFDDFYQSPGSNWTAGSIYTSQVGMPAFFNKHNLDSNSLFQHSSDIKLTGLGHIFKKAGYVSKYIIGNPEFAGMKSIIELFNYEIVSESNSIGNYQKTDAGLHDLDVFNEIKKQIDKISENPEQPFAIFASTINTHFPEGIYDWRMMRYIGEKSGPLEFSIAATDYLIQDLLQYLTQKQLLDDTVIYIFPDHLMMGNSGPIISELKKQPRRLFLLTNAKESDLNRDLNKRLFQADIPRIIINGANIKTNAKFLRDFIKDDHYNQFLNLNKVRLATLNNAAFKRNSLIDGFKISIDNNSAKIKSAAYNLEIRLNEYDKNGYYQVILNTDMIELENSRISQSERYKKPRKNDLNRIYLEFQIQNDAIVSSRLANNIDAEIIKQSNNHEYTHDDIQQIVTATRTLNEALSKSPKKSKRELIADYAKNQNRFIAHAGGKINNLTYTNSLEALNHNYKKGFRLFELDIIETKDGHLVAAHDWKTWQNKTGFDSALPPTLDQFLKTKIHQNLTPLDMEAINRWFEQHHDAILVTDKINNPKRVANEFIDNSRLMMELFTWQAVEQASQLKIKSVMPTGDLLVNNNFKLIEKLHSLNIKDVAISRRWADQSAIVSLLANQGFNIYAFHINFDKGKDEVYLVCNESNLFYGLYADDWNFPEKFNCNK